jgi:hypothetical protein
VTRRGLALVAAALWVGCRPPPPAPEDLDSVAAFLFSEHGNQDRLSEGLVNLQAWFEDGFDPEQDRGFQLSVVLDQETVDGIDASVVWTHPDLKEGRAADGMLGAAVGTAGTQSMDDYVFALTGMPQDEVFPDTFAEWSRTWRLCDGDDFADQTCLTAEADEQQDSRFGLGFNSQGESYNQYQWVELPDGSWAMNHRNWQVYPPEVSSNLIEVFDQYYLNTFVPSVDGTHIFRLQATWAVFGDGVPEDLGLNLTANSMFDSSVELEEWLEERNSNE